MSDHAKRPSRSPEQLRDDALAIWQAGVEAVRSDRLVEMNVRRFGETLIVGEQELSLKEIRKLVVVGGGKAGAGMAIGLERTLGDELMDRLQVEGWLNVPEDCVRPLKRIRLHGARPAGVNEPTAAGVAGTEHMLKLVGTLDPEDICLCLMSGGGSALMPAPVPGITLADKQSVTKFLSAAGANIQQLNTVRKHLSRFKGGGLARACHSGQLISLIISDVLGDPLDVIASGPTVSDPTSPRDALEILKTFGAARGGVPERVLQVLEAACAKPNDRGVPEHVQNLVIGNNAVAVDAAGVEAEKRGYSHAMLASTSLEGLAEELGAHHASMARRMVHEEGPDCLITGGEPVVKLADAAIRGRGGRNQQLVLSALVELLRYESVNSELFDRLVILSGGTDGEDGPTDAAGAFVDRNVLAEMKRQNLDPNSYLKRNDAYSFFDRTGGLLKTGPTDTNVCDVRVVTVAR